MTMYFFYQETEKSKWFPALASERESVIRQRKPALVSVLDVDNSFDADLTLDEIRNLRYSGPLYFDWDASDINEATQHFKEFLTNLQARGVPLDMLRLYATGKKGYHCEIPMQVFMGKVPANGLPNLPDIYREIAHALYVPTLDLRIYTARRGRMWRCPNVLRDNGKYKVQISADEALNMTTALYDQVCSSPRNALPIEPPAFNAELGLLYAQSRDKVEKGVTKKKSKKAQSEPLKKFGGEWPETLQHILLGVTVKPGVGWNMISMQLAITASELGKTEEQMLADAEPLIISHESDSTRYNSPRKRRDDLREMFRYVAGNPCYEFSVGGVMALVMPEVRANCDLSIGDFIPDTPLTVVAGATGEGADTHDTQDTTEAEGDPTVEIIPEEEENAPIRLSRAGIFTRNETGYVKACAIGMGRVTLLRKMDEVDVGYEVEVFKDGKPKGLHIVPMDRLASKANFQAWSFTWSASMGASDAQTSKLADILSRRAERNNNVTYIVTREGIDLLVRPGKPGQTEATATELVWSCPEKVVSSKGGNYRFRSNLDKYGAFRSDLMNAPALTEEDADLIENLLQINTTENLGKLLGWFSAAFLCQIIRRYYRQFPSLQCFGQAGAGKSKTTGLLNHLHYYLKEPKSLMAQGQTQYPMLAAMGSSASQPVIFEEVKAREMSKPLKDFLLNLFRNNYDGHMMARGTLTKDASAKEITINEFDNSGPVAFVGESVENQSAILERCIVVSLSKQDRYGKNEHFHAVAERRTDLGKLGKAIACNVLALDIAQMRKDFDGIFKQVRRSIGPRAEEFERPAFNIAVVVLGLKLLQDTLHPVFGDRFDARVMEMREHLITHAASGMPENMSEMARVLDVMAQLSRNQDAQYRLDRNVDYTVSADGRTMDLKLRTAYVKYVRWQRSLSMEVLFDNESAFIAAATNYAGVVKRACPENEALYDSPRAVIYRFNLDYLDNEKVDAFETSHH